MSIYHVDFIIAALYFICGKIPSSNWTGQLGKVIDVVAFVLALLFFVLGMIQWLGVHG